jgi:hypothetical protein
MLDIALVALAVGVCAAATAKAAGSLDLSAWRAATAVASAAALAGLVASESASPELQSWWGRHPLAAALATSIPLLALTALVVEAALQRALAAAEERRWRPAARVACEALLVRAADATRPQRNFIALMSTQLERARVDSLPTPPPPLGPALRRAVLEAAPVLTATERLHSIYRLALEAAAAARDVDLFLADWTDTGGPPRFQRTSLSPENSSMRASGSPGGRASRQPGTR